MRIAEKYGSKSFLSVAQFPGKAGIALAGTASYRPSMAWLLSLDQDGVRKWEHEDDGAIVEDVYGGGQEGSCFEGVAVYPDGGVVAVGTWGIFRDAVPKGFVRRFTADGAVAWERYFGNDKVGGSFSACAALDDGGLVVVGHDWQRAISNCVIRLDGAGDEVWNARLNDRDAWPQAIAVYAGGDLLIAGGAKSPSGEDQACVARLNPEGAPVFSWIWADEPGRSRFNAAMARPDGSAVIGGWAAVDGARYGSEALVMMIDQAGRPVWRLRLPGRGNATNGGWEETEVTGVATVADGIFLSGWRKDPSSGQRHAWAAMVGLDGEPIWQDCYGGDLSGSFNGVVALDDGSALFAGSIRDAIGKDEAWLARIDANGKLQDEPRN